MILSVGYLQYPQNAVVYLAISPKDNMVFRALPEGCRHVEAIQGFRKISIYQDPSRSSMRMLRQWPKGGKVSNQWTMTFREEEGPPHYNIIYADTHFVIVTKW